MCKQIVTYATKELVIPWNFLFLSSVVVLAVRKHFDENAGRPLLEASRAGNSQAVLEAIGSQASPDFEGRPNTPLYKSV